MSILLQSSWTSRPPLGTPIDWGHPLAQGLVAWIDADGDRVSGAPLSLMGAAVRNADGTITSPGGSSDGAYVPFPPNLIDIVSAFSIISFCQISSLVSYSYILNVPYSSAWSSPYAAIALYRNASNADAACACNSENDIYQFRSNDSMLAADNVYSCRAVSKSPSDAIFYKDFAQIGYEYLYGSGSISQAPYFGNRQAVSIGTYSSTVPREPVGGVFGPQIIYSRALSFDELALLNANPWAMFARRRMWFLPTTVAYAGVATCGLSAAATAEAAVAASPEAAVLAMTGKRPGTYWCAAVGAWTDFPSEWADEETAWQPVSTDAMPTKASVDTTTPGASASPVSLGTPLTAGITVQAAQAQAVVASVAAVSAAVSAALAALETTTASLAYAQAAAALLESAAQAAEGLAATIADPGAATLTATAYTPTVSTTAEVVAQVAAAMLALEALTPTTSSAATATPGVASLTVAAREAAGTALARIEVAVATLSMAAGDAATQSACTAEVSAATLAAILGDHTGSPLAIVTPNTASAALLSGAVTALAETAAPTTSALIQIIAKAVVASNGVKEIVRLSSPIFTTARLGSRFVALFAADSPIATRARLRSYIETEQT